ncbi:MAG: radical SAM protein [Euryarchaeota archaeon]|nr:radical SAM protein [Euryarchaeota archaeon]
MRLITLNRTKPNASVEFYGCPMQCKYCSHTSAHFRDHDLDKVVQVMTDNGIRSVFLGGAEPAVHGKEALELIRILHARGKDVILKTTGMDPDFVAASKGHVKRYVLEVKAPLDDPDLLTSLTSYGPEKAKEHLEKVARTLEVLKGQRVRAVLRIIPGRYTEESVERVAKDLSGYVDELQVTQFMSSQNDVGFAGITNPSPDQETMMAYGRAARKHLPRVKVKGSGFEVVL